MRGVLLRLRDRVRGARRLRAERGALVLDPPLEAAGVAGVEAAEQIAAVELERLAVVLRRHVRAERRRVAPQPRRVEPDFLRAARHDDAAA